MTPTTAERSRSSSSTTQRKTSRVRPPSLPSVRSSRDSPTLSTTPTVNAGDRVAQLILERIVTPEPQEVASLADTVRGAGGFGSTGGFGAATASAAKAVVSDEVAREVEAVAAREKEAAAASA